MKGITLKYHWFWWLIIASITILSGIFACNTTQSTAELSFNKDIRPIINEKCISCHGGVKESGKLSFLT
ncbi:MAG: hypothetical protein KDD99_33030, partial [Bacteroidetes bacterium]|nr:hypothetical protein [Bacteroidota bacterium]